MQYKKKIFVIAGEASGDQLGGILLSKLKKSDKSDRDQILKESDTFNLNKYNNKI